MSKRPYISSHWARTVDRRVYIVIVLLERHKSLHAHWIHPHIYVVSVWKQSIAQNNEKRQQTFVIKLKLRSLRALFLFHCFFFFFVFLFQTLRLTLLPVCCCYFVCFADLCVHSILVCGVRCTHYTFSTCLRAHSFFCLYLKPPIGHRL